MGYTKGREGEGKELPCILETEARAEERKREYLAEIYWWWLPESCRLRISQVANTQIYHFGRVLCMQVCSAVKEVVVGRSEC